LKPPFAAAVPGVANSIVDVAAANGGFKTLLAAVDAAGLTPTLKSAGSFTVLAPTDAAFKVLPVKTIETLLKPENKALLTSILTYHVFPNKVTSSEVVRTHIFRTVNGKNVIVKLQGGRVFFNDALVQVVDIPAANGVIHVIDTVLIP
jgi:transforming growth factor-beta-induced protein